MKKLAQKPASFNETVPSTEQGMQQAETQGGPQPKKEAVVDPSSDQQYAAMPMGDQQQQQQESIVPPEMVAAAQAFLGPEVMQAAMQGDQNAMDLVARSAAQFSSTFMNMAAGGGQPAPGAAGMEMAGQQVPGQQAPVGITSPEEDLAAELVPNVPAAQPGVPGQPGQPGQNQSPQGQEQPGQAAGQSPTPNKEGENEQENKEPNQNQPPQQNNQEGLDQNGNPQMVDIATVVKIINLVKAGKI